MIKTYENFNNDNSKIWITGIPSGECLQITREALDSLYREELLSYSTQYSEIGFYAFDDDNIDLIKRYVEPNKVGANKISNKNITVNKNDFDKIVIETILSIVDEYPMEIEMYIEDDTIGITYDDLYIEIVISEDSPKYFLVKRHNAKIIDRYRVGTDVDLISRVDHELYN